MTSRTWSRTPITLALTLAILCTYSMVGLAQQGQTGPTGDLSVVGEVTVNGTSAISGATVFSDSTVTTGQNSSAVVSLGKLGRVELLPNSSLKLSFTDTGMTGMLDQGRVRISSSSGVSAVVTTKDGSAVADLNQPNVFMVDVECGDTLVATQSGKVELRAGNTVKQIAAGNQDTAGTASGPGTRCTRYQMPEMEGLSSAGLAALLLGVGGAIAAAIFAAQGDDITFGDGPIVISPSR